MQTRFYYTVAKHLEWLARGPSDVHACSRRTKDGCSTRIGYIYVKHEKLTHIGKSVLHFFHDARKRTRASTDEQRSGGTLAICAPPRE
ncbi:MAG: hypothetical protein D8M22_01285 [Armatimonadetes bacterium]|nr:hypothetical protein [Armatimonadota bacterium]